MLKKREKDCQKFIRADHAKEEKKSLACQENSTTWESIFFPVSG